MSGREITSTKLLVANVLLNSLRQIIMIRSPSRNRLDRRPDNSGDKGGDNTLEVRGAPTRNTEQIRS